MPATPAITSSGGASQPKRPRPIPKEIRAVIALMVHGTEDDPQPLSFVEAARAVGVKPDRARHYLDRAEIRRLLIAERRAWRAAICAGNELACFPYASQGRILGSNSRTTRN